jgi:hypothetical protein
MPRKMRSAGREAIIRDLSEYGRLVHDAFQKEVGR